MKGVRRVLRRLRDDERRLVPAGHDHPAGRVGHPGLAGPGRVLHHGDGRAWVHLVASGGADSGVRLWADESYRRLQVFTGDPLGPDLRRRALAVEPMTCPPNAFVTGDGLLILQPGEAVTYTLGIDVF